jgi:ribosomal protein S18 acetylase RimI-like enzyme
MHPLPVVRLATPSDADIAAETLADAFAADPVLSWILRPTVRLRHHRIRAMWEHTIHGYLRHDKPLYVTTDSDGRANGQGAALWAPPGTWLPSSAEQLRDLPRYAAIFGLGALRANRFATDVMRKHPRSPSHWYLYAIGTSTSAQGRGVGSALLRDMLDRIDEEQAPAYLESSNIRNVPLYERYGFAVVEEIRLGGGGPPMWRMWREPGS